DFGCPGTLTLSVSCAGSLSPTSQSFSYTGGTGSVTVTAGPGCAWTAVSNAGWITINSGSSGMGNGTVSYAVAANPAITPRTGTITIAGQPFTGSQAGAPCSFSISPSTQSLPSQGGIGSVAVTALAGCNWTAGSNASWVAIVSGASGTGNGTVTYSVGL